MADLTITDASVVDTGGSRKSGTAGETITAGQVVYLDDTSGKLKLADATNADKYQAVGIALNGASDNQPITYVTSTDDLDLGATLTIGTVYVLSTGGGIAPSTDLVTGDYTVTLGVATATDKMKMEILQADAPAA